MKTRGVLKYILSVLAAAVLLWFSFKGVDWKEFAAGVKSCNWGMVALSMTAGLTAFLFRALRWRRLMLPVYPEADRLTVFNAINIGNISNFVFQYLGEFVKTGIVVKRRRSRGQEGGFDKILGTVVLERGWDLFAPVVLFILLLVFGWNKFGEFFRTQIWESISERFTVSAWVLIAAVCAVLAACCATVIMLRKKVRLFERICSLGRGLWQGFTSCLRMDRKWLFLFYTAVIWTMYWLMMVFIIRAFPETAASGMDLVDALFLMIVGSIASFVPVPGGFGAYHFLVSTAMAAIYGFTKAEGMVFATIAHESQALNMIIWGIVSYLIEMLRYASSSSKPRTRAGQPEA